jgi:hypothetical protein
MNIYSYWDNANGGVCIFQTNANTILEADKILQDSIGINPVSRPTIGCTIEEDRWYENDPEY